MFVHCEAGGDSEAFVQRPVLSLGWLVGVLTLVVGVGFEAAVVVGWRCEVIMWGALAQGMINMFVGEAILRVLPEALYTECRADVSLTEPSVYRMIAPFA